MAAARAALFLLLLASCAAPVSQLAPEIATEPTAVQVPERAPDAGAGPCVGGLLRGVDPWLLPFDGEREELTTDYLRSHTGADASAQMVPRVVVLHWTGGGSAEGAWRTFEPTRLMGRPELAGAGALNVSAHFLVDQQGTTWQLLPATTAARHAIGLNHTSVGIENVGGPEHPLTDAQVVANARLVRQLAECFPIEVLVGHSEYRGLEGSLWFREADPGYRTTKLDPGGEFMRRVRQSLKDMSLATATSWRNQSEDTPPEHPPPAKLDR